MTNNTLVSNSVLDKLYQPFVVKGIKETTNVCIEYPVLPSDIFDSVGTPICNARTYEAQYPGSHVPLSTLQICRYRHTHMNWEQCGLLILHRTTLAFATTSPVSPAHGDILETREIPTLKPDDLPDHFKPGTDTSGEHR